MSLTFPRISRLRYDELLDGIELDGDHWLDKQVAQSRLDDQTARMAAILYEQGDETIYRPKEKWISMVSRSGVARPIISSRYAHRKILPTTMQADSRAMLKDLQAYASSLRFTRMMIATEGSRCVLADLETVLASHSRRVRQQLCPYLRRNGCMPFLIRTEFTIEKKPDDPEPTYHVHSHILYDCTKFFGSSGFSDLVKGCQSVMGGRTVKDSGRIRNLAEACKYCCKIESRNKRDYQLGLLDLSPSQVFDLSRILKGKKMLRPIGDFRAFRQRLRGDCVVMGKIGCGDKRTFVEVEKEKASAINATYEKKARTAIDIVIGRKTGAFTRPIIERHLLVVNYSGDLDMLLAKRGLTRSVFDVRPNSSVHNVTPTVVEPCSFSSRQFDGDDPPNGRDPPKASILFQNAGHQDNSDEK